MRGYHYGSLKYICTNKNCDKFEKIVYRRFDILVDMVCDSCQQLLTRHTNSVTDARYSKARDEIKKLEIKL